MNGPEGFLPKKQNFTMQVVQVLWYCPIFQCPSAFRDGEKLELQIFVHLYLVTVTFDTEAELLVICLCWLEHGMGAQHRYYRYILSTAGNVVSLLSRFWGHLGSGGTRQTGAQ